MSSKKINYLDFFKTVGKSKKLLRSGFVREKIKDPESVAEHSFRVGLLAMVLSNKLGFELDKEKLIKMALLHDIGEIVTGDIVVQRGEVLDIELRDQKEQQEEKGIREIFGKIGEGEIYREIFAQMIQRQTPEAKIFWQFDKLELALQALEYEEEQGHQLDEFFLDAKTNISDPFLRKLLEEIIENRPKKGSKK